MKTKLTICISIALQLLFGDIKTTAQPTPAGDSINAGDASALMYSDGAAFWNFATNLPAYRVPKTGQASSIYAASQWIGGMDKGGHLHMAAETYRQNGDDFWPGPIMDSLDYSPHQDTLWNHVWKVNKSTIDSFKLGLFKTIPPSIQNWPGNGDTTLGEAFNLAPYVDVDNNGAYNPSGGDYPLIRGDQALYMIYNDDRGLKHGETGGLKMGVEVHLMAYQFNMPSDTAVYQTTFLHYDIYNRSKNNYDSVYLGYWCDMDLGNGGDDFIGCDSANNFWYTYNGEATDPNGSGNFVGEQGYGGPVPPPPAQGVAYLCDTMMHFQYYNNDVSVTGNPASDFNYYDYMKSIWKDGSHVTYDGSGYQSSALNTNYMFGGNLATGAGWSEVSNKDAFGDRRGLSSAGPFTLAAGSYKAMDIALVFARADTGNQFTSVTVLGNAIKDVRNFYTAQDYLCDQNLTGINEAGSANKESVGAILYPNPNNGVFQLEISNYQLGVKGVVEIYNVLGQQIYSQSFSTFNSSLSINISNQSPGIYLYRVIGESGTQIAMGKFIINHS